jgi:putative tricarboxylic transport membrane protein
MQPSSQPVRHPILTRVVVTLGLCFGLPSAIAQTAWKPERNVELVVGASPGGGTDIVARVLQKIFTSQGTLPSAVVVNKPGGSHTLAWAYLKQHTGDAHYLSIVNEPLVTNRIIGLTPLSYRDFTPLTVLFNEYMVFLVKPDSPIKSGRDLLARLKSAPSQLTIGFASAPANNSHFSLGLAAVAAGADLRQLKTVIFKSGGESLTALLGGHIEVGVTPVATAIGHIEAGRLRPIALTSPERLSGPLAAVPTWKDQGANFTYGSWRVAFGPADMSPAEIAFWEAAFKRALAGEDWKKEIARRQQRSSFHTAAETRTFLESEEARLKPLIEELGLVKK